MRSQLLAKKPLKLLLDEMAGEHRLLRVLGPVQLTSLGVGAIIGAGIFVATGKAAHDVAGPALMLSYVVAGSACVFAALCYAEFASMVPVAGSAYTYAYTTLGELFAWIIGWDLVLEYAVSAATVTHGASAYFQDLIGIFGLKLPASLSRAPFDFDALTGKWYATGTLLDSPALVVTALVTVILVIGIKESASFNAAMVILKLAIVLMVIGLGVFYIDPRNWHPFSPYGLTGVSFFGKTLFGQTDAAGQPMGMLAGGAIIFFAYIGFDSVSTHAEEARNPQRDVPIGIIVSLILCTVLYIAVTGVLTGMVPYNKLDINAPVADAFKQKGLTWAQLLISLGAVAGITSVVLVTMPGSDPAGNGARRIAPGEVLCCRPRAVSHSVEVNNSDRHLCWDDRCPFADRCLTDPGKHRDFACVCDRVCGGAHHAPNAPEYEAALSSAACAACADTRNSDLSAAYVFAAG